TVSKRTPATGRKRYRPMAAASTTDVNRALNRASPSQPWRSRTARARGLASTTSGVRDPVSSSQVRKKSTPWSEIRQPTSTTPARSTNRMKHLGEIFNGEGCRDERTAGEQTALERSGWGTRHWACSDRINTCKCRARAVDTETGKV